MFNLGSTHYQYSSSNRAHYQHIDENEIWEFKSQHLLSYSNYPCLHFWYVVLFFSVLFLFLLVLLHSALEERRNQCFLRAVNWLFLASFQSCPINTPFFTCSITLLFSAMNKEGWLTAFPWNGGMQVVTSILSNKPYILHLISRNTGKGF